LPFGHRTKPQEMEVTTTSDWKRAEGGTQGGTLSVR
jgi:hypothetical protein